MQIQKFLLCSMLMLSKRIKPDQIKYLYARTHLNPTYEYGVSFERGTAVDFEDRRQIIISGTASINNHGEIVFSW